MTFSLFFAALLPVIPQPTSWTPAENARVAAPQTAVCWKAVDDPSLGREGYRMTISPSNVVVEVHSVPTQPRSLGVVWSEQTLAQLRKANPVLPCGTIVDVPKYRVRGLVMDVGRMYHSMAFLYDLARTMAYFKMNTLHIHLNDNEIEKNPKADWSKKQAAFRLECETCPALTAKDGHYTKAEFRQFIKDCAKMGVTVVPEIDVPAHALAFTRVKPAFASQKYGEDHFDLDKTDEILAWLKPIFAEYLAGDDPVFATPYMHVGTDEYNKAEAEKFRVFTDKMLRLVQSFNYKPCAWGALTHAKGQTPVLAHADITMDIWHNPYYQPAEALAAGYSIVSVPDGLVYLVPFAGYYYNYLNCHYLFDHWEPRNIANYVVPDDKLGQLAGGKFALWNDLLGKKKDGTPYTENDNWDRLYPAIQTVGQKCWKGACPEQDWHAYVNLAESLTEPDGVKRTHAFRYAR